MSLIASTFSFRNLDAAISNMAKNFAEGTDYFKVRMCFRGDLVALWQPSAFGNSSAEILSRLIGVYFSEVLK
jgi:hypothetical protein